MTGSESLSGLDLDGDVVWPRPVAIMAAVNQEPPGADRRKPGEAFRHPVRLRQGLDGKGPCLSAGLGLGDLEQVLLRRPIRPLLEIDDHAPVVLVDLGDVDALRLEHRIVAERHGKGTGAGLVKG